VELTPFNGLPHLVKPVIVDTDEVSGGLKGLMREMFRRYRMMEDAGSRNIVAYNKKAKNDEQLPYLVLVVDELADLMMSASGDVEHNLVRLAQLGRATGIHLVLATQRPSVQVVTGLLKANIPGRVAFAVASNVDSRVILDTVGAEKLLGQGDMLLLSNSSPKPKRVQGTLVKDSEISAMVKYWVNQNGPELLPLPMDFSDDDDDEMIDDKILDESRKLAIRYPNMSRSHLERQLRIGATKAGRIINILEEEGLVNMSF
jgi:S-DNA-T family DNA segregation ATPase FtsK/SpoIIIE